MQRNTVQIQDDHAIVFIEDFLNITLQLMCCNIDHFLEQLTSDYQQPRMMFILAPSSQSSLALKRKHNIKSFCLLSTSLF
jgi:hypothetical protein